MEKRKRRTKIELYREKFKIIAEAFCIHCDGWNLFTREHVKRVSYAKKYNPTATAKFEKKCSHCLKKTSIKIEAQ